MAACTKHWPYCTEPFEARQANQTHCGKINCRRAFTRDYMREYRAVVREYGRARLDAALRRDTARKAAA